MTVVESAPGAVWRVANGGMWVDGGGYYAKSLIKGFPDICGILASGRMFVIEIKRGKKSRVQPEQVLWLALLQKLGALVIVATSVDDVADALEGIA